MAKRKKTPQDDPAHDPIRGYAMWQDRTGRSSCTPIEWQRQAVTEPFYLHLPPPHGLGLTPVVRVGGQERERVEGRVIRRG